MKKKNQKNLYQLSITVLLSIFFSFFTISIYFLEKVFGFFELYTTFPIMDILINSSFLILLSTLWVTYRSWKSAYIKQTELENIIDSISPDLLLVINSDRDITVCTNSVKRLFGYTVSEVIGQKTDLLYFDRRTLTKRPHEIYDILEKDGFHIGFATGKKKTGDTFPLEIVTGNLSGRNGAVLLLRDVSERKKVDQLKDDILSTVSHELRTPLSMIKESVSILNDEIAGKLNETQKKIVTGAFTNSNRLARMINNLLDLSRIKKGKFDLQKASVNIFNLLQQTAEGFTSAIEKKGLEYSIAIPKKEILVEIDEDKIYEVLSNLLDNAIKFTSKGTIQVIVVNKPMEILCIVTDTGCGILKHDLSEVFDEFRQFKGMDQTGEKGMGLGLSIAKHFVHMHGGTISAKSKVNEGTSLSFTIPK
ncbi:ATP-binding protein [Chlamydiota bacterium]